MNAATNCFTGRNLMTTPKLLFPDASGTWHVCVIGWRDNRLEPAEPSIMDPFICDDSATYYALDIIKDAQGARQIWSVGAMRLFPYCKSLDRGRWGTSMVPPSVLLHHDGALHSLQDVDGVDYLSGRGMRGGTRYGTESQLLLIRSQVFEKKFSN
eukprot:SAG31_NODE_531_length_14413_cov_7.712659_22_plen_155_part_00